jgi:hypothetical protein
MTPDFYFHEPPDPGTNFWPAVLVKERRPLFTLEWLLGIYAEAIDTFERRCVADDRDPMPIAVHSAAMHFKDLPADLRPQSPNTFTLIARCGQCAGTGKPTGAEIESTCPVCKGNGMLVVFFKSLGELQAHAVKAAL